jgi:DME family drug/metabolite transporter
MGYLEIAAAGTIWASTGPLLKIIQRSGFTSWDIVLSRSIISTCLLGLYIALRSLSRRGVPGPDNREAVQPVVESRDILNLALIGFLAVVFSQSTYFYALSQTSVAVAVTLNYTSPFFVMVLSFLLYRESITKGKIVALTGAVLGVALTSGLLGPSLHSTGLKMSIPGVAAGLLSGLGYGLQTIVYKQAGRKYGPIHLNFWTMAFGSLHLFTIVTLVTGRIPQVFSKIVHAETGTLLLLFLIGLGPGTLAFILFADGINRVDATRGCIMAMSEPVAACLLGYFVLGETLAPTQVIGVGLVLVSIWAVTIPEAAGNKRRVPGSGVSG